MTGIAKTAAAASMVALTMVRRDMSLLSYARFPTVLDDLRGFQVPAQQIKSSGRARAEPSALGSAVRKRVGLLRRGRGRRLRWHDDAWRERNVLYGPHAADPIPRVAEAATWQADLLLIVERH